MNKLRKYTAWLGAGAIMLTIAAGCADQNNNGVPDAAGNVAVATGNTMSNMADAGGDTASNMADAAGNTAAVDATGNMADATSNAVAGTGSAITNLGDAMTYTPKIKTALGANAAMKGSNVNVDTLGSKDSIALHGTVTSKAQKTLAENIAKQNAKGFKIINQLVVKGKM